MHRIFILFIFYSSFLCVDAKNVSITVRLQSPSNSSKCPHHSAKDKVTQAVLENFAKIVTNFAIIVQDPENRENVSTQAAQMLGNIVQMVVEATKQRNLKNTKEITQFIENSFDDESKAQLVHIIITHLAPVKTIKSKGNSNA